MRFLLDTHIVLWYLTEDPALSQQVKDWISSGENDVFYSLVSVWEVAIKHQHTKHSMPLSEDEFVEFAEETGIKRLGLTKEHIMTLRTLTWRGTTREHHDPFDRMLISQAKSENMFFLTHDHLLPGYEEPCVISV